MSTGKTVEGGQFLPNSPSMEDVFKRIGIKGGWDALNRAGDPAGKPKSQRAREDLMRAYAQFASHPVGEKIIEDLLDQTLRRGFSHPDPQAGFEQEALYNRERKGQNGIVCYILKMIHDGRNLRDDAA